ncbi:8311_t:CDS:2, partial [Racocetra fulgida]
VKKDDFKQSLAQATIQIESSLDHKCKANKIDDEYGAWSYFMVIERGAEAGESFERNEGNKK